MLHHWAWMCLLLLNPSAVESRSRYLIYSVNPGEGFNLRRDVHMRAANLVLRLRQESSDNWQIVLPPWPQLYHWRLPVKQNWLPWQCFFDLPHLNQHIPSIEFKEFLELNNHMIDEVFHLQNLPFNGQFEDRLEEVECREDVLLPYSQQSQNWFGEDGISVRQIRCLAVMGRAAIMASILRKSSANSFLITRFETLLHDQFGGRDYWNARHSMVYAAALRNEGNRFMQDALAYHPGEGLGRTRPHRGGGDFLAVHLRRRDYIHAHPNAVPSIAEAAYQISQVQKKTGLQTVFLATDAPESEKLQLRELVAGPMVWFNPTKEQIELHGDGGLAIIDQWIAAHARYFTGTAQSTFSFRIREDRQFMGMGADSTFNQLCGDDPTKCPDGPATWLLPPSFIKDEL